MDKLKVGIYGENGHQIWQFLEGYDKVSFVACAKVSPESVKNYSAYKNGTLKMYDTLELMLENSDLDLVCLCSPIRAQQADDAIKVLLHNVSVYAEKPCALSEYDLNRILEAEKNSKGEFHEIADTAFSRPYTTMKKLIDNGEVGEIVQIYAQKSYPSNFENRPEDANIDGGITRQAGIHAARFIEHTCGLKIKEVSAFETVKGAPVEKPDLVTACSAIMTLENGGVASMCINYFNPKSFGLWGNETLRVFGTKGVIEITDGGRRTHLWNDKGDMGELPLLDKPKHFFEMLVEHLLYGSDMPFDFETELSPLKAVIKIKNSAKNV